MFGIKSKAKSTEDALEERSSWIPNAGDARDSIMDTAHRTAERARGTVSSAFDQLSEISLPDSLQNVSLPGRRQRKRRRSRLLIVGLIAALAAAGGYCIYRWLNREDQSVDYGVQESWPSEPNPGPTTAARESDAEASLDAEQSAAALNGATARAQAKP